MKLGALPAFGEAVQAGTHRFLRVSGHLDRFVYVPDALDVPDRTPPSIGPDFSLELVRGLDPSAPPAPYGVLDFRLTCPAPPTEALAALRDLEPHAVLSLPTFLQGFLRLRWLADAQDGDPSLENPVRLASNGLDTMRLVRRLTTGQVALLKHVLGQLTSTFVGHAELEMAGLAPQVPARLEVAPERLILALAELADGDRRITRAHIVGFWMRDPSQLPITPIAGFDAGDQALRADALADWTIAKVARYVPAPGDEPSPTVQLATPRPGDEEALVWDLSAPRPVSRVVMLRSNPFLAAQRAVAERGLAAVCTETIVPALQTGVVLVSVAVNLPRGLQGVLKLGVDLIAPPRPPLRVQPLTASLLFDDATAVQTVRWRFSPQEDVAFRLSTFAVVRDGTSVVRLNGEASSHEGPSLLLGVDDFPLRFLPVRANAALLAEATVHGTCRYVRTSRPQPVEVPFVLTAIEPAVCLTLPRDAGEGQIALEARSLTSAAVVPMGTAPLASLQLDLFSVREYGPHRVEIEAVFDRVVPLVAVDLLPEDGDARGEEVTVLAFTPDRPRREWAYFARSPFRAGYRFRWHPAEGASIAWSAPQSPFDVLRLQTSAQA